MEENAPSQGRDACDMVHKLFEIARDNIDIFPFDTTILENCKEHVKNLSNRPINNVYKLTMTGNIESLEAKYVKHIDPQFVENMNDFKYYLRK
jgi:hypothetical protein